VSGSGYLVIGPESTGTKLSAALLRAAGCRYVAIEGGDDGAELPLAGRPPLIRRSLPWGHPGAGQSRTWPKVADLLSLLAVDDPHAVVTTRDWFATARSQVDRGLVSDEQTAIANIRRAYGEIFATLRELGVPFSIATYEAMVSQRAYPGLLLGLLRLPPARVEVYDGNRKWYEPETAGTGGP
jgi:hypothetical protein